MSNRWHCLKDLKILGPFAWQQIKQMVSAELIKPDDMLRSDENPDWKPAGSFAELFPTKTKTPAMPTAVPVAQPVKAKAAATKSVPAGVSVVTNSKAAVGEAPQVIPAGKAVSVTPALPVGKVAAPPASTPVSPPFAFGEVDTKTTTDSKGKKSATLPAKKKKSNIGLIAGVVVAVLLVIGLVVVMMSGNGASNELAEKNKAAETKTMTPPTDDAATSKQSVAKSEKGNVDHLALIRSVTQWHSGGTVGAQKIRTKINRVWFSATTSGTELPNASTANSISIPEGAKYVFVEMDISNDNGNPPFEYSGWSQTSILLDELGNPFSPVPLDVTQAMKRVSTATIRTGGSTLDILAFELGEGGRIPHRLVLPHKNLGFKSEKAFGFELAKMLTPKAEVAANAIPAAKPEIASADSSPTKEKMPTEEAAKPDMKSAEAKPKSDVDEVDDFIKGLAKKAKQEEEDTAALRKKIAEEAEKKKEMEEMKKE